MTFTTKLIFVLASSLLIISTAEARDPNKKWTLEEAAKSHQENVGERASKKTDHKKYWDLWHSIDRVPDPLELGNSGSELEEVWTGSAASVNVSTFGQGEYYVEISFGHSNQGGAAWLTIDNTNLKKNVAIPSPFNYEGNYHITYESGTLATYQSKTSGTPKITRISKFPTKQLNDCTAGTTESKDTFCRSGEKTCETGRDSRTCATNGGWMPWRNTRNPVCVSQRQSCP